LGISEISKHRKNPQTWRRNIEAALNIKNRKSCKCINPQTYKTFYFRKTFKLTGVLVNSQKKSSKSMLIED